MIFWCFIQHTAYFYGFFYAFVSLFPLENFSQHGPLMDFYWILSDSRSYQVFRFLQCIRVDFNSTMVCNIPIHLIPRSCRLFFKPHGNIPSAPITIGKTISLMFHIFFYLSGKIQLFAYLFVSLTFPLWGAGRTKSTRLQVLFSLFFSLFPYYP